MIPSLFEQVVSPDTSITSAETAFYEWTVDNTPMNSTATWFSGVLLVDLLQGVQSCTSVIKILITGGTNSQKDSLQIGSVELRQFATKDLCTTLVAEEQVLITANACPRSLSECPMLDESTGVVYVDDGTGLSSIWNAFNVQVQNNDASMFGGDAVRYARACGPPPPPPPL